MDNVFNCTFNSISNHKLQLWPTKAQLNTICNAPRIGYIDPGLCIGKSTDWVQVYRQQRFNANCSRSLSVDFQWLLLSGRSIDLCMEGPCSREDDTRLHV